VRDGADKKLGRDALLQLIGRVAGLSLKGLAESLPGIVQRRSGTDWVSRLGEVRSEAETKGQGFWVDTLIRFASGEREFLQTREFQNAYAEAQYKRAGILYLAGDQEALAAKAYFRAAIVFEALKRPTPWRQALKNRASILAMLGQGRGRLDHLDQAVRSYESCIRAADKTTEPALWAELQADLGYALMEIGSITNNSAIYARAAEAYQAGASVLKPEGAQAKLWGRIQNNLGATYALWGELQSDPAVIIKGIAAHQEALRVRSFEAAPDLWLSTVTNILQAEAAIADITRNTERLRRAHSILAEQVEAARTATLTPQQLAHSFGQLGTTAQVLGEMERKPADLQAAVNFYDQSLAGYPRASHPFIVARLEAHRAASMFRLGEITRDAALMVQAITVFEELEGKFAHKDRPHLWAYWQQMRGKMRERLAGFARRDELSALSRAAARSALEGALAIYRREIYPQQWAETSASLCRTLLRMAVTPDDWRHLSNVVDDLIETVHTFALAGTSRAQQRSLLRTLQSMGDLAAFAHIRLGEPHRAFEALTTARAVGSDLAFRLASGKHDDNALPDSEPFRRWQSLQIAVERQLRESLDQAGKAQPVAAERLEELRAAYQELMTSLKVSGALEQERMDVAAFAQALSPASAAVLIFASELGGGILIVTPGAASIPASAMIELPQLTSGRLEALLNGEGEKAGGWLSAYERYRKESSSWDEAEVEQAVAAWNSEIEALLPQLWDLAMGPLAAWLEREAPDVDAVYLMVPGLMSMLPLHAARPAQSDAPYFAERWAVSYLPSPRALMTRSALGQLREPSLLAITDPAGDIGEDVNPAWPFFAAPNRRTVQGRAPNVAAALAGAGDVSHVSFFCHGIWEGSDPDLSHLVMADGSQLSAQDLAAIDLRSVDLALLGACETALIGTRGTPDEFTGLPVALLQAGVGSVAASQWLVDAASTYALMHRMMQEHRAGLSPARALKAAQRAFVAGEMDTIQELPGGTAVLSRLRTLRPLSAPGADSKGNAGPRADQSLPPRSAPFFWAAFAVIGRG
jgi:tetratricopeptide (TPR) repeat protein